MSRPVATPSPTDPEHIAETVRTWLHEADRVLITSGAGLSAAAGYDYDDSARFKELFPALHRLGLRSRYLVGMPLPPALLWGYWAVHIDDIRFSAHPNPLYQQLHSLVGKTDHWVMTSNVDALFARNGFDPDRVFTPQGDYGRFQCSIPCTRTTWDSKPLVDALLASYDPATGTITDPDALPRCPHCGADVQINVRIGPEFVDDSYLPALRGLQDWLRTTPTDARLLVLEFGAGFSTPGVIRYPGEGIARRFPKARFVRVNPDHPEVPADLGARALPVHSSAAQMIDMVRRATPDPCPTSSPQY
ncbi:SIR2 family NAD-dependent protein deacylase [Streptacidiphilus rugosus]|uniref:NAD-dependent protein deacetylase of SIR2 family n=1 Tax=Streptacidiphilus rugosus TaxID=405783 RepID=UPI000ADF7193|nr:NAD-dependent protein deacetylase of SIR2 family [Streptacidiphilus rugosus]